LISRLFPYYLAVKKHEKKASNYREEEYKLTFTSADQPATSEIDWLAQIMIYQQLEAARFNS
ncbi:MAG: hypothetical protein HC878_12695, partial [Leptolyngbyaceae cyanobacterium SL_5_14]|nr:hypothetical protein [Leptolyngbyaceae cyanobacterium SL_5_14]